jgi:hypothetical protein
VFTSTHGFPELIDQEFWLVDGANDRQQKMHAILIFMNVVFFLFAILGQSMCVVAAG